MIKYISDVIAWGLNEDYWAEDSLLIEGYNECFGKLLTCDDMFVWQEKSENALYIEFGNGKRFRIVIEEEANCIE